MDYQEFIESKRHTSNDYGFKSIWYPKTIFDFQKYIIEKAIKKALKNGTTFGAPTKCEIELAEKIINIFP